MPLLKVDQHHKPILLNFHLPLKNDDTDCYDIRLDFRHYDVSAVCRSITAINWNVTLNENSVDDAVIEFYNLIHDIIREHVPRKNNQAARSFNQPWWNDDLRHFRNRLRKIRKRYFKHRSEENWITLQSMEREYSSMRRTAFREYISGLEHKAKSDPSSFWKFVKNQRKPNSVTREISFQNEHASSATDSANLLAAFFKSVFNENSTQVTHEVLDGVLSYDLRMPPMEVTVDEVYQRLSDLDTTKGPGPDEIPPLFIKQCAESLALPLSILFNRSLTNRVFPALWKEASITPIHKSGNLTNAENYRGISILSCFSKILECFFHEALYRAVLSVIPEVQHGFVKNRSTTTNLMMPYISILQRLSIEYLTDYLLQSYKKWASPSGQHLGYAHICTLSFRQN